MRALCTRSVLAGWLPDWIVVRSLGRSAGQVRGYSWVAMEGLFGLFQEGLDEVKADGGLVNVREDHGGEVRFFS